MSWLKGYLYREVGREIGKDKGEAVFFNPENGLLIVKDGTDPYITSLAAMSQFKLGLFDQSFIEKLLEVHYPEVIEEVKFEVVNNKYKANKKR